MTTVEPKTNLRAGLGQCPRPTCASSATERFSLAETLQAAARGLDTDRLRPAAPSDAGLACQPRTLLTLLAYCYASQIYGSAEVEVVLRRDPNFHALCRDQLPDARLIRRFRRENREALGVCLEAALRFMTEQKVAQGLITRVNQERIAEEARRRIIMAMFTDSMELDKDQTSDTPVDLCYLIAKDGSRGH